MRFVWPLIPVALAVSACSPTALGTSGQTTSGEAIVGEIVVDSMNRETKLVIQNPKGWVCESEFRSIPTGPDRTKNQTVPLTCNNGATGNAISTYDELAKSIIVAFSLSNGESGSLRMGRQ